MALSGLRLDQPDSYNHNPWLPSTTTVLNPPTSGMSFNAASLTATAAAAKP